MKKLFSHTLIFLFIIISGTVLTENIHALNSGDDEIFKKAQAHFFRKQFPMAEPLLLRVIQNDPGNALAYSYLGDIYLTGKKYDDAIEIYSKAVNIDPGIAENYFRIGQAYYHKNNASMAIQNFERSLRVDSGISIAYYHIGLTYLMLERDKPGTIENWTIFLREAPTDPQHDRIRRAIALLQDPGFQLPPKDSDVTIEEALLLGGLSFTTVERSAEDKKSGDESRRTIDATEGIIIDDDDL